MAIESVNYQCPSCGGTMRYDGASGRLVCDFCGTAHLPSDIEAIYAARQASADASAEEASRRAEAGTLSEYEQMASGSGAAVALTDEVIAEAVNAQGADGGADDPIASFLSRASWNESERAGLRSFACSSCGASLTCDATTAVSACPYCGNTAVVPGTFVETARPDLVVPFKVDKAAATAALTAHYKGKRFLPKDFADANRIEHIQGVYVPFWLYDGTAEGSEAFEARNVRTHRSGDEEITETDIYSVYRAGEVGFTRVPADASAKMPNGHMDAIEPFDYRSLVPFSLAYMPGYLAERFDEDAEACASRVHGRMRQSREDELRASVRGYDEVRSGFLDAQVRVESVSQALFPVWMLHTRWQDGDYLFAMDGQTGRLVGDLPVSWGKVVLWFFGLFAVLCMVLSGLDFGFLQFDDTLASMLVDIGLPIVGAASICAVFYSQMKTARERSEAHEYIDADGLELSASQDTFIETRRSSRHLD